MSQITKRLQWLNDWFVRPSEAEMLQMEIAYWKMMHSEALAQQEALKEQFEIQNREFGLYSAYSATLIDQQKEAFDTF